MDRGRALVIGRYAAVYPIVTIAVTAIVATITDVHVGLAILGISVVGAAVLTGLFLNDTRAMRSAAAETDTGGSSILGFSGDGGPDTRAPGSRRDRLILYAGGLFVLSVLLVLYFGGLFG